MQAMTKFFGNILTTLFLILVGAATGATAATFTVTNTNNTGAGSLRDAVTQANANGQADTINFDPAVFGSAQTITLTSEIIITPDGANPGRLLTINGPGSNLLTVSGGNTTRLFFSQNNSSLSMSGMTLRDGNGAGPDVNFTNSGGAMVAFANDLTLANMVFTNNRLSSNDGLNVVGGLLINNPGPKSVSISNSVFRANSCDCLGGGLHIAAGGNASSLTMTDTLITENAARMVGGFSENGTFQKTVRNVTISNNQATSDNGGARFSGGTLTLANSQITGNRAGASPGVGGSKGGLDIAVLNGGTVTDTIISNNSAGRVGDPPVGGAGVIGGVNVDSSNVVFRRVTVSGNVDYSILNSGFAGGAGMNIRAAGSTTVIIDSLISNNRHLTPSGQPNASNRSGGGISTGGVSDSIFIINTTITGNSAGTGGGIWNNSTVLKVINSTIAGNTATGAGGNPQDDDGGGIFNTGPTFGQGIITIQNSIVAGNTAPVGPDVTGSFTSNGFNIIGNTANSSGFNAAGDRPNVNPLLGALANNGGATPTMALQTGSPAINNGNNALAVDQNGSPLLYDQRGACFERISGGGVDIGAFEFGANAACTSNGKSVGVFRPTNGITYLRNSNTGGFADISMIYGVNGDTSIAGDWNGDRVDSLGIYRNGVFYLRNTNTTGAADIVFAFGSPGDQPVAGDWNGDGIDTIGVYRPTTGVFLLRNTNTAGAPDLAFVLGNPGDVAIAGDWNGDGITTTGVFRPTNGIVYLKNTNVSGDADIGLVYGNAGDKPVAGDWNADGIDSIGIYRNGVFYLRNSNTQGVADIVFAFGNPGDEPIAGDWDGLP